MIAYVQQSPLARYLIVGASIVIVVAGMRASAPVLAPVLFALFIAMAISPVLRGMRARGLPGWLALLLMIVAVIAVGLTFIMVLYGSLDKLAARLPEYEEMLMARGAPLGSWLASRGIDLSSIISSGVIDPGALARAAVTVLREAIAGLSQALLILVIVLFMLGEAPRFSTKLGRVLPPQSGFTASFARFSQTIQSQIRIQTIGNLAVSLVFTTALIILRVDFAVLWGIGTFFLAYIPNIGVPLSAIPPILMAYVQYGIGTASVVLLLIIVLNLAWDNQIAPRAMARGPNLAPVVVFLSFIFWSWVFGVIGALLAVPLTVALKLIFEAAKETRWLAVVLSATIPALTAVSMEQDTRQERRMQE